VLAILEVLAVALAAMTASAVGCTDWNAFSSTYEGPGVCATYVVGGDTHSCVRKSNGSLQCWGDNRYGQLGVGDTTSRPAPTHVPISDVSKVFLPTGNGEITADLANFSCAITTDNALLCWGDNRSTQFGAAPDRVLSPAKVAVLSGSPSYVAIGGGYMCVLDASGSVACLGSNASGQLGVDGPQNRPTPVQVEGLVADKLLAGVSHTCARRPDGTMLCWGSNVFGQLGTGDSVSRSKPLEVTALAGRVARLATGANHTCAQTPEGELWCWGDNRYGQLGLGDRANRSSPAKLPGALDASSKVFAGGGHSCAIHADGSFWCWGDNRSGQLGVGDTDPRLAPTQVTTLGNGVAAAYTGGAHTCVLKTDASVWCWGNNQYGQLGVDVGPQTSLPVRVIPPCQ
jgi:alpha-tubulin suppressor-like RCC1 family protein